MNSHGRGEENREERAGSVITKETFGMTLLFFSVVLLLFAIIGSYMLGEIGVAINAFLLGVLGFFIYPFLLLCIYFALVLISGKKFVSGKWLLRGLLIAVCVFLIAHLGTSLRFYGEGFGSYLSGCWNAAETSAAGATAGGAVFGLVVYPMRALLTTAGAYVIFAILLTAALILFLWATPLKRRLVRARAGKERTLSERRAEGEVAFEDLPSRTAPFRAEERMPRRDEPERELRYGADRPQRSAYEARYPERPTARAEQQETPKSTEPDGRAILFGGDPARDFWGNLAYRGHYGERVRRSTVQPVDGSTQESKPTVAREELPSRYSEDYRQAAEQPQAQRPRSVVEAREEPRESGYTLRGEDLNYTQVPSYRATELPPEPDEPRDYYEHDVPTEFSEESDFDESIQEERTERFEPEPERFEPERFDEEEQDESDEIPEIPSLFPERGEGLFGRDREISFDERRESFESDESEEFGREPMERTERMGFGEPEESVGGSRAVKGLERGSRAELFDDDEPEEEFDVAPRRAGEFAIDNTPPAPAPKPKHVYKPYRRPSTAQLRQYDDKPSVPQDEIERNSEIIIDTLAGFRVDAEVTNVTIGPCVTRYDIDIPRNISLNTVTKRSGEIAMRLHARQVALRVNSRAGTISIEVPNSVRATVGLASVMQSEEYQSSKTGDLMFAIGKDIEGRNICGNIAKMKHLLVAGATGSGKSVCLNTMLVSLICKYSPEELRLILIDPKQVEFMVYEKLPHLMINEIISDPQKVIMALNWAIKEMDRRYEVFGQKTRSGVAVRDLDEYNNSLTEDEEKLPKIVIVVDELADLMLRAKKEIEDRIQNLTQKSRAAGIHLILATQRPSVNVITGVIKSNLPTRIAFRVAQEVDSRTILDEGGAEKLLGYGDLLYKTDTMFNCERVQGAFLSSEEVLTIVTEIKQNNESYFDPEVSEYINKPEVEESDDEMQDSGRGYSGNTGGDDPLYVQSLAIVVKLGTASISLIQRKCNVGYNHAGKIMEWMEEKGYVSPFDGKAKARTVLLTREEFESKYGPLD